MCISVIHLPSMVDSNAAKEAAETSTIASANAFIRAKPSLALVTHGAREKFYQISFSAN
jgi:hypothetical protein